MSGKRKKVNTKAIRCTHCFKSVSVPSRMVIYSYLKDKDDATVGDIVKQVNLTQPTVSYHLKEMRFSGLLKSKRVGKEVYYSLSRQCPHLEQDCILQGLEFPEA